MLQWSYFEQSNKRSELLIEDLIFKSLGLPLVPSTPFPTVLLKGGSNFEKSSRVWYIFSEAIFCPEKENKNLKMFGWEKSPLEYHIFWRKHPRKKWQKVDPHYFSILEGVYFLHFCPKNPLRPSKLQFYPLKPSKWLEVDIFQQIAVLRHLEWFLEKIEESRPPLKLKNNGGLLSNIFH